MKKIIGALLVGAMIGGAAFAELNSSLNVRAGGFLVANEKDSDAIDRTTWFDLDAVTGTDAFTFKAANEYAGVTLNYNPKLGSGDGNNNAAKTIWSAGNGVELTGFVKPASWLKLQIGAHKDGIFFVEQCKKDWDDTNWSAAGKFAGLYKPGVLTKNSTGFFLDSLTDYQNNCAQYAMADLSFADVGPGTLGIRLTAVDATKDGKSSNAYNWIKEKSADQAKKDTETYMAAIPGAMVSYTAKNLFKANIDFQMASSNDIALGVYFSPLMVKNLTGLLGYTMSTTLDKDKGTMGKVANGNAVTFSAIDFRVRYVIDKFSISNAFNYTFASEDGMVAQGNGSKATGNAQLWDSLFALYKLNDKFWISLNFQIDVVMDATKVGKEVNIVGTKNYAETKLSSKATVMDMYVTPGVIYTVGKGASITAGLNIAMIDVTGERPDAKTLTGISVPVIFRVKL